MFPSVYGHAQVTATCVSIGLYPHAASMTEEGLETSASAFRAALSLLLQTLLQFQPDMVILSIGFDGFIDDPSGGGMGLTQEDYHAATRVLMQNGKYKFISILEEGYEIAREGFSSCMSEVVVNYRK